MSSHDKNRGVLTILSAAAMICWGSGQAVATVYLVCPDGSGDFETIQDGIDAAVDGDVVELCDAVFSGNGNYFCRYWGKAITVRSASGEPEQCVIDLGFGWDPAFYFGSGEGPASVLEGITIRGGGSITTGGGLACFHSSPTIINCRIVENTAVFGGGISTEYGAPTFRDCVISGNTTWPGYVGCADGAGVSCVGSNARFENCTITGNKSCRDAGGLHLHLGTYEMVNCTISGNHSAAGGGLDLTGVTLTLDRCIVWGNCADGSADEIFLRDATSSIAVICSDIDSSGVSGPGTVQYLSGNLFVNPLFCEPETCSAAPTIAGDYRLAANSPCLDAPGCGLIGALGKGCGAIPVEASSWGWIKSLYR